MDYKRVFSLYITTNRISVEKWVDNINHEYEVLAATSSLLCINKEVLSKITELYYDRVFPDMYIADRIGESMEGNYGDKI